MVPFYQQGDISLYNGDLRAVLPELPEASVDFVCSDPPYGLSFMERNWDHEVPGPEYWRAIARVCKPGAVLAAFGGPRTYHRLTCAIEYAGWKIRDCLMWLYGQGMPKCGDIGKLIDTSKGAERQVVGDKLDRPGYHLHEGKGGGCYGDGDGLHAPGTDARLRAAQITAPATPEATVWTGWAMALKPAWEPIILAMRPMDGTIAHNALIWGVAGLNIEASRIGTESTVRTRGDSVTKAGWASTNRSPVGGSECGRWPANLLLDEVAAAQLDAQTGTLTSGTNCVRRKTPSFLEHAGAGKPGDVQVTYGDSGGASRFFYCGKAAGTERNAGLDDFFWHQSDRKNDWQRIPQADYDRLIAENDAAKAAGKRPSHVVSQGNIHPTVKPLDLMCYLLTLLSTPDGGVILDPFAGSGTTLLAAQRLGRPCIGVELSKENCEIAAARLGI